MHIETGESDYPAYLNYVHFGEATLTFPQTLVLRYVHFETQERRLPQVADDYARCFLARLRRLEPCLQQHAFLAQTTFTAADMSVGYALVAQHLGLATRFTPAVAAYWQSLRMRDGFRRALDAPSRAYFEAGREADLRQFFDEACVSPVFTAHPTEVQRKSILNCQMPIARLIDERDRVQLTPDEQRENTQAIERGILTLWQTRLLRQSKLSVMDEVENCLSIFKSTIFDSLPRLYGPLEDILCEQDATWTNVELTSFIKVGS